MTRPSYKGIKIKPRGIKEWLRARGLHWGCFCGITAPPNVHLSSRIIHTVEGDVFVLCHDEVSSCKFFCKQFIHSKPETCTNSLVVNLFHLYEIVAHTSEYPSIPKLGESLFRSITHTFFNYLIDHNRDTGRSEMADSDVVNFHLKQLTMSEIAPLLKGFCGDFVRGVEQMAGTSQIPLRTVKTCEFKPINYYICLTHLSEQQSAEIRVHCSHFGVLQCLSHLLPLSSAHQTVDLL